MSNNTDYQDDNGHGTHVAGTIGANTNNCQGVFDWIDVRDNNIIEPGDYFGMLEVYCLVKVKVLF